MVQHAILFFITNYNIYSNISHVAAFVTTRSLIKEHELNLSYRFRASSSKCQTPMWCERTDLRTCCCSYMFSLSDSFKWETLKGCGSTWKQQYKTSLLPSVWSSVVTDIWVAVTSSRKEVLLQNVCQCCHMWRNPKTNCVVLTRTQFPHQLSDLRRKTSSMV